MYDDYSTTNIIVYLDGSETSNHESEDAENL